MHEPPLIMVSRPLESPPLWCRLWYIKELFTLRETIMYDALGLGVHDLKHGVSPYPDISRIRAALHTDLYNGDHFDVYLGKQAVG